MTSFATEPTPSTAWLRAFDERASAPAARRQAMRRVIVDHVLARASTGYDLDHALRDAGLNPRQAGDRPACSLWITPANGCGPQLVAADWELEAVHALMDATFGGEIRTLPRGLRWEIKPTEESDRRRLPSVMIDFVPPRESPGAASGGGRLVASGTPS
jgi:hypothetical protein